MGVVSLVLAIHLILLLFISPDRGTEQNDLSAIPGAVLLSASESVQHSSTPGERSESACIAIESVRGALAQPSIVHCRQRACATEYGATCPT